MAAKAKRAAAGGGMWLQGMICGAVLTFATPSAFLAGVLLLPALVTLVIDRAPARKMTRAVALACSAFAYAPLWQLWVDGETMGLALKQILDPSVVCPAWLAGAFAWGVCEILPVGLRIMAEIRAKSRLAALRAEAEALRAAWDLGA